MKQHFETYLKRCDWPTTATIDYASFKHLLRFFVERRRRQFDDSYIAMDESLATSEATLPRLDDSILSTHPAFRKQEESETKNPGTTNSPILQHTKPSLLQQQEKYEFFTLLQFEINKASAYYKTCLQRVYDCLDSNASDALLQTALFHAATMITVRQIIIRYNAFQRSFAKETDYDQYFLCGGSNGDDIIYLHNVFQWHEIAQLQYVISQQYGKDVFADGILQELEQVLSQSELVLQNSMTDNHQYWRDLLSSKLLRNYMLFGLLQKSHTIGRHLKLEMRAVAKLKLRQRNAPPELHPSNRFPLFLNLLSCFLFMMNNYIIEPSSAYYANALGANDALSGLMIGGAAWFAIGSAVLYSYWTNDCYKTPIVFAGILMVVGNLLYGAADAFGSMTVCLMGRALTGLGAPRVINRRYVADATPFHLRTLASAGFCLATAFGSALGPGVAIVLDATPEFSVNLWGRVYEWNGMTAPGYFMAVLWCVYTITIVLTFQEPVRSGLMELQERERQNLEQGVSTDLPILEEEIGNSCDETEQMDDSNSVGSFSTRSHFSNIGRNTPMFSCCCRHVTRAVALTMSLIFMKRIALESIVGSTSVITKNRYGWSIQNVGTLHLVNGILVIPVSAVAGWLSTFYEDRFLATAFLGVTLAGMMVMVDYADLGTLDFADKTQVGYEIDNAWSVGPIKYIAGSLIAFSGIEACESYVASMMSKVVPSALAVGTFNSGLLATLVGTGGRAAGDLFITLMGLISIRQLLNLLILPGLLLVALSILLIRANYRILDV